MSTLDALDAELAALLGRRRNGYFSDADQIRLQELIDTREAIEVKYRLSPADADGFDTIRKKLGGRGGPGAGARQDGCRRDRV